MGSIKKNLIYNIFYQLLVILIPLITTPYISRVLGANKIGVYSYAYSIANYFVLFIMLGLNNYGNRTIASIRDDKFQRSKNFIGIYLMQLATGLAFNILYIIYCFFISNDIAISLALGLYVFSGIFDINWFFFGMEKFKLTVIRNTIIKIITTVCIFLFVKSNKDILTYSIILSLGTLISQVVLWTYLPKYIQPVKINVDDILIHIKPNLCLFLTVIGVSLYKTMDKIMLGYMCPKQQLGFYESAEKIVNIPIAMVTSLGTVMLPRMTNLKSKRDNKTFNKYMENSVLFAMLTSSVLCFGIMGVSKIFIPLFYGEGFETCIDLYLILLPSCLFLAFGNVIRTQFILPNKMDKIYIISAFIGALINLVLNLFLIPKFSAVGAAIGTLFAEASVCIYQMVKVKKYLPIKKYLKKSFIFIIIGIVMFLTLFNNYIIMSNRFLMLLVNILYGGFIYISLLMLCVLVYKMKKHSHKYIS